MHHYTPRSEQNTTSVLGGRRDTCPDGGLNRWYPSFYFPEYHANASFCPGPASKNVNSSSPARSISQAESRSFPSGSNSDLRASRPTSSHEYRERQPPRTDLRSGSDSASRYNRPTRPDSYGSAHLDNTRDMRSSRYPSSRDPRAGSNDRILREGLHPYPRQERAGPRDSFSHPRAPSANTEPRNYNHPPSPSRYSGRRSGAYDAEVRSNRQPMLFGTRPVTVDVTHEPGQDRAHSPSHHPRAATGDAGPRDHDHPSFGERHIERPSISNDATALAPRRPVLFGANPVIMNTAYEKGGARGGGREKR